MALGDDHDLVVVGDFHAGGADRSRELGGRRTRLGLGIVDGRGGAGRDDGHGDSAVLGGAASDQEGFDRAAGEWGRRKRGSLAELYFVSRCAPFRRYSGKGSQFPFFRDNIRALF